MRIDFEVETINSQLRTEFGFDAVTSMPIWRIVWADEQFEKRFGEFEDFTPNGIFIRKVKEVRLVPKYPWIKERYILERLELVPSIHSDELLGRQVTYGVKWSYENDKKEYRPPTYEFTKFIIDTINAAIGKSNLRKYVDPEDENPIEHRIDRINRLGKELYGNETPAGDALAYGTGVVNKFESDTKLALNSPTKEN